MKSNCFERVENTSIFLKSQHHNLAIGKVFYSKILGGYIVTNQLKDPMVGFVNE